MSQFSASTVLAGRYKILNTLTGDQSIDRYRALDQQSNTEVEIITPTAKNVLNPALRSQFLETHKQNQLRREGYLSCLHTCLEGSAPIAVYPSIRAILPDTLSLSSAQALQLAQFTAPLLRDAKEPLYYSNLVITEEGLLRYRPRGYTSKGNLILGHPLEDPSTARGAPFALSMIIYHALHTLPKWKKRQEQVEWLSHTVSLQAQDANTPPELEEIFQTLLSGETPELEPAIFQLDVPKELPLKTPQKQSTIVNQTEQLQRTSRTRTSARIDIPYPDWVLFLSPPIGEQNLKVLSAVLNLDPEKLSTQLESGPVPICGSGSKQDVEKMKQSFSELGLKVALRQGSLFTPTVLGTAILGPLMGAGLFMINPLLGLGAMFLAAIFEAVFFFSRATQQRRFKEVQSNRAYTDLETALQQVRNKIFLSELPQIAKSDYYEMIDEIEQLGKDGAQKEYALDLIAQVNPVMQDELSNPASPQNAENVKLKLQKLQQMSQL